MLAACSAELLRRHSTRKFFSKSFSGKKVKNIAEIEVDYFRVSLSMKKSVEIRQNNSGRGYTGRDVSLSCAFDRSYFCLLLHQSYIHANQPFSVVHSEQNVNTTVLAILRLPHILTLITFLTNVLLQ